MGKMLEELGLVLVKQQTTYGTEETGLLAADHIEPLPGAKVAWDPSVSKIKLVAGGFSHEKSVIGPLEAAVSLKLPMRTGGAQDSFGDLGKMLKLSGFTESILSHVATYAQSSAAGSWKDATVWGYSGNLDSNGALLRILYNVLFGWKFTFNFVDDGYAIAEFTGKGAAKGPATNSTQPAVTKSTADIFPLVGVNHRIIGVTGLIPVSIEFDGGVEVISTAKPSVAVIGKGMSLFTNRQVTWTAQVYKELTSIADIETMITNRTIDDIYVSWGSAPNAIAVSASNCQIENYEDSEQNGVSCWKLNGIVLDNDITVSMATTVA